MQVIFVEKGNVHAEGGPCIVLTSFEEGGAHYGNLVAEEDRAALQALRGVAEPGLEVELRAAALLVRLSGAEEAFAAITALIR